MSGFFFKSGDSPTVDVIFISSEGISAGRMRKLWKVCYKTPERPGDIFEDPSELAGCERIQKFKRIDAQGKAGSNGDPILETTQFIAYEEIT